MWVLITQDTILSLFPEIEGEGNELSEYNSLRKSLESSVSLFRSLRDELSSMKVVECVT